MKAQTLSISIPNVGCDKNCSYCVSKMTGYQIANEELISRNLCKVVNLAKFANVTSVIITGKGEPFLNEEWLKTFVEEFREFPIEIQTNGLLLLKEKNRLERFHDILEYINVIAFSVDDIKQLDKFNPLFKKLKEEYGIVIRITVNLFDNSRDLNFADFLAKAKEVGVQQLSFRKLTIPNNRKINELADKTANWIIENAKDNVYEKIADQISNNPKFLIRELPFGAKVYDIEGIAVTHFEYCVQDKNDNEDIRTLIFAEDGHVYTSWNSEASILF